MGERGTFPPFFSSGKPYLSQASSFPPSLPYFPHFPHFVPFFISPLRTLGLAIGYIRSLWPRGARGSAGAGRQLFVQQQKGAQKLKNYLPLLCVFPYQRNA